MNNEMVYPITRRTGIEDYIEEWGLTKREYFAGQAMQAFLTRYGPEGEKECAVISIKYADALLAELAKPTREGE